MPRARPGARIPGIQAVAQLINNHRGPIARTLRETYGVGLSDLGDGITWGEARLLIEEASADPSTALGAKLAGWAYKATMPELLSIAAQLGKNAAEVMPWSEKFKRPEQATPEEITVALAELDTEIIFTT